MTNPSTAAEATTTPLWQWRLMAAVLIGMAAGFMSAWLLGWHDEAPQAAIVASLTLAAGSRGRMATALPVALVLGLIVVVYSTVGAATTGKPWAAALAMALVAFTTSVMTSAKPVGLLVGMVASYAYFLVTGVGVIMDSSIGKSLGDIGLLGLVGLATGLVLVAVRVLVEQMLGIVPPPSTRSGGPTLLAPMIESVRSFDGTAKDGVRRAIALGLTMYGFQAIDSHGAFWVMLTVFVILQPNGRSTVSSAIVRVTGTFIGVMGVVIIAPLLPTTVDTVLAVLALAISLAVSSRSSTLSAAFGAAAATVLVGVQHDNILGYAGARLLDTLIGTAIALTAGYLLWPRQRLGDSAVPADLAGDAAVSGIAAP